MKYILTALILALLAGCFESKPESTRYTQLVELVSTLQSADSPDVNKLKATYPQDLIDDALALRERAHSGGYTLITPRELSQQLDTYIIIATMPRGIYNLGLIPNAKHFEFALSPSLLPDGRAWDWHSDALGRAQEEFIALLGADKNAKILFYDTGEHILSPVGSAQVGLMWARHLGYTRLYRLVGGLNAWKDSSLPLSTQAPKCCQM